MNTLAKSAVAPQVERTLSAPRPHVSPTALEMVGANFTRYALVIVLLWIGALKFTAAEAAGIQGLVANSPLMSWLYRVFTVQGASNLIGTSKSLLPYCLRSSSFRAEPRSSEALAPS